MFAKLLAGGFEPTTFCGLAFEGGVLTIKPGGTLFMKNWPDVNMCYSGFEEVRHDLE